MVIPAVGGAVLIAIAGLALAVVLYVGFTMTAAIVNWLIVRIADSARALPVVGGQVARLVLAVWQTTYWMVKAWENLAQGRLWVIERNFRHALNYYLAPLFLQVWKTEGQLLEFANYMWFRTIPDIWHNLDAHFAQIGALWQVLMRVEGIAVRMWTVEVPGLWRSVVALENRVLAIETQAIVAIWRDIRAAQADIVLLVTAVRELQGFLPLLRTLAEFESITVGGLRGLGIRVGDLERVEADILRDLARVLPLSVVAALGIAAIMNLQRVARDPCHCLTAGDFNDLPARVDALEEMGP